MIEVQAIDSFDRLDALRDEWIALHAEDRAATVFVSWWWLRAWFEVSPYPWSVLVARDSSRLIGLLPISPRGSRSAVRLDQVREIHAAGDPAADYRGVILAPDSEAEGVTAFGDYFARGRAWDRLVWKDVLDLRLLRIVERAAEIETGSARVQTPGSACPWLDLPGDWDGYLRLLTPPSRKSLKKRMRIAESHGARLTTLQHVDPDQQLRILLTLAQRRGRSTGEHLARVRTILESCMRGGCAEISVLWLDDQPAAAQASFIDPHARSIGHYVTGFDERFASLSPGRVLDALCIRDAIARGFRSIDFLRGDEPYKHQLGAVDRRTTHVTLTRTRATTRVRLALSRARTRLGI